MDKNAIKKFAVWARRELIERVSQKAMQYGIEKDNIVDAAADSVGCDKCRELAAPVMFPSLATAKK